MKGKGWGNRGDCLGYGSGRWQRFDHCDCQALVGLERWSRRLPTLALAVAGPARATGDRRIGAYVAKCQNPANSS